MEADSTQPQMRTTGLDKAGTQPCHAQTSDAQTFVIMSLCCVPSVSMIICYMAIENMLNDTERREKLLLRSESKNELQEALVLHHRQDSSCSWLHGDDRPWFCSCLLRDQPEERIQHDWWMKAFPSPAFRLITVVHGLSPTDPLLISILTWNNWPQK